MTEAVDAQTPVLAKRCTVGANLNEPSDQLWGRDRRPVVGWGGRDHHRSSRGHCSAAAWGGRPQPRYALACASVAPRKAKGPVLIEIGYRIAPETRGDFLAAIDALGRVRRRDGALDWGVYEDESEPGTFIEIYFSSTWGDHLRQHDRITRADDIIQSSVDAFHIGPEPKRVRHLLAARPTKGEA